MLFRSGDSDGWARREPIAAQLGAGGGAAGVRSGLVSWEDEFQWDFIPSDATYRSTQGEAATPWDGPAGALPWGCDQILTGALAQTCAFARLWSVVKDSTTEPYDLVVVDPKDLGTPRVKLSVPGWLAFRTWTVKLIKNAEGTRA